MLSNRDVVYMMKEFLRLHSENDKESDLAASQTVHIQCFGHVSNNNIVTISFFHGTYNKYSLSMNKRGSF